MHQGSGALTCGVPTCACATPWLCSAFDRVLNGVATLPEPLEDGDEYHVVDVVLKCLHTLLITCNQ